MWSARKVTTERVSTGRCGPQEENSDLQREMLTASFRVSDAVGGQDDLQDRKSPPPEAGK